MNTIATTARELASRLPIVTAGSMLHAQGYIPTEAERAAIRDMSDFFVSMNMGPSVNVKVVDHDGHRIGSLTFHA